MFSEDHGTLWTEDHAHESTSVDAFDGSILGSSLRFDPAEEDKECFCWAQETKISEVSQRCGSRPQKSVHRTIDVFRDLMSPVT